MIQPRRPLRLLLAGLAALALLLASCSSSGSDDADKKDDTSTTTTAAKDDATTTTAAADPDAPSDEDLEALLPAAADLGTGWEEDTSADDSSDDTDKAIEEQCPEAAALASNDDDSDEVKRSFVDAESRQIEVSVSGTAEEAGEEQVTALVDAINACDPITLESEGATTTMDLEAEASSDYGDEAIQMHAAVSITAEGLEQPVELNLYLLLFRNGPVGVQITAGDGFDSDTLAVTPADTDLLTSLAGSLDESSAQLAGN